MALVVRWLWLYDGSGYKVAPWHKTNVSWLHQFQNIPGNLWLNLHFHWYHGNIKPYLCTTSKGRRFIWPLPAESLWHHWVVRVALTNRRHRAKRVRQQTKTKDSQITDNKLQRTPTITHHLPAPLTSRPQMQSTLWEITHILRSHRSSLKQSTTSTAGIPQKSRKPKEHQKSTKRALVKVC